MDPGPVPMSNPVYCRLGSVYGLTDTLQPKHSNKDKNGVNVRLHVFYHTCTHAIDATEAIKQDMRWFVRKSSGH